MVVLVVLVAFVVVVDAVAIVWCRVVDLRWYSLGSRAAEIVALRGCSPLGMAFRRRQWVESSFSNVYRVAVVWLLGRFGVDFRDFRLLALFWDHSWMFFHLFVDLFFGSISIACGIYGPRGGGLQTTVTILVPFWSHPAEIFAPFAGL